jgi:hypothetical protein
MSASLIGRLGQALSGYPPTPVSMSLTGCATATPAKGRLIAALCWEAFFETVIQSCSFSRSPARQII